MTAYNCIPHWAIQPPEGLNFGDYPGIISMDWDLSHFDCPHATYRSLLRFDELTTIPTNATIIRAKLKLYGLPNEGHSCYPGSPYNSYCPNTAYIQRVTSGWNDKTVTWNTQPSTDTNNQITILQSTSQYWNFTDSSANLVTMLQNMVSNPTSNFGFMMKLETETIYRGLKFASSDYFDPALHPELIVTYELTGRKDTTIFATICYGDTYSKNGFNESETGIYYDTLQNVKGCDSVVILNLTVLPPNEDTLFISAEICEGDIYSQNGFNESKSGSYPRTLHNIYGCDSIICLNLTVNPTPNVEITAITGNFCEEDFVIIQIITDGDSFLWNTGSSENPITVTKSGVYSATAILGDCKKTAEYTVEECPCELWLPNIFTPNNDGINDVFAPVVRSNLASFSMYIYDRWGQVIYWTDVYSSWDGTHNGRFAVAGVYYCVIKYTCANDPTKVHNKQGSVTLVR
jgi:gliding motility-associated-like protein